jgi:hypothetical protein
MPLDAITKKQIKSYVLDYLKLRNPDFVQSSKKGLFTCPKCKQLSANIYPPKSGIVHCFTPDCQGKIGDIFDICRTIDFQGQDLKDEDIADLLVEELGIKTQNEIKEFLQKYQKWGWSLVPVEKNSKRANIESGWQSKTHTNLDEWIDWLGSGINVGVNCGKISNVTLIDIDTKKIPQDLQKFVGETLTQESPNGWHLVYFYEADLPTINLRTTSCNLPVEIRSDGNQTVVFPSVVDGKERHWNNKEPIKMPEELKSWLLERVIIKDAPKEILTAPTETLLEDLKIKGLEGKCNTSFIKVAGLFRKQLNVQQTEYVLGIVNDLLLDTPLPKKDLKNMMKEIQKYSTADVSVLQKQVTDYLNRHDEASARDLVEVLKMERRDIQEVLAQLIQENRVYKQRSLYKIIKDIEWKSTFIDDIKTLPYKIPYFHDYCVCREGDQLIIGGNPGTGKTHLAMNFIKKFVEQGVTPYYYGTESKSRYLKVGMELGLKEGDYWYASGYEPSKIELKDNSVTVLDWLDIDDFATTGQVYKLLQKQLDKHNGLLIIFSQLNSNDAFYAENQLKFYGALVAKYLFTRAGGVVDTQNTYFKVEKIRESKSGQQYLTIPTKFNPDNKTVELRKP